MRAEGQKYIVSDSDFEVRGRPDVAKRSDELIAKNKAFIIGCVRKHAFGPIEENRFDELVSIGMTAFYEALETYDAGKGHFYPFAEMIIRRRIIDETRRVHKEGNLIYLGDIESDREREEGEGPRPIDIISVERHQRDAERLSLAEEILRYSETLKQHGLTFQDLVKHSPKHAALRKDYEVILRAILSNPGAVHSILVKRIFPVKKIQEITQIPRKKIERARIYMISAVLIATGEGFEGLREYLPCVREVL
ncbi:MAG: hypothetical protein LBR44_01850 [Clostridiales Family XIII bacterium]|jgi:RNA polymerase sigma factor|nr:hypothetical protein [Clostridiales Family XIII bacterium]